MANIPVSTAIDNLLKSTPSTTVTTVAALTALGAAVKGTGDIVNADISATAAIAPSKLNMSTARILGRTTASTGAVEEIQVGSGLSLASGTLTATGTGAGDVVGPASATENAIARFDLATGKLLKNSSVAVSDAGAITTQPSTASVIPFYHADQATFPSANTYHGAIAHSHNDAAMYYAHGGSWVKMLDASGTSIRTVNGSSLLGNGDVAVTGSDVINVTAATYGAVGDGRLIDTYLNTSGVATQGASMTSGANIVTVTGGTFASNDVNKYICIQGVGTLPTGTITASAMVYDVNGNYISGGVITAVTLTGNGSVGAYPANTTIDFEVESLGSANPPTDNTLSVSASNPSPASQSSGTVTLIFNSPHGFTTGDLVDVSGITGFTGTNPNSRFTITVTSVTQITYALTGSAGTYGVSSATVKGVSIRGIDGVLRMTTDANGQASTLSILPSSVSTKYPNGGGGREYANPKLVFPETGLIGTITAFTDTTHVTISRNAPSSFSNKPCFFGTNNTTAIQAAIDAAYNSTTIKTVYIPTGIFLCNVTSYSDIKLIGAGGGIGLANNLTFSGQNIASRGKTNPTVLMPAVGYKPVVYLPDGAGALVSRMCIHGAPSLMNNVGVQVGSFYGNEFVALGFLMNQVNFCGFKYALAAARIADSMLENITATYCGIIFYLTQPDENHYTDQTTINCCYGNFIRDMFLYCVGGKSVQLISCDYTNSGPIAKIKSGTRLTIIGMNMEASPILYPSNAVQANADLIEAIGGASVIINSLRFLPANNWTNGAVIKEDTNRTNAAAIISVLSSDTGGSGMYRTNSGKYPNLLPKGAVISRWNSGFTTKTMSEISTRAYAGAGKMGRFKSWGEYFPTPPPSNKMVTAAALASNVVTLTTSVAHGMSAGMQVVVDGIGFTTTNPNGTFIVVSAPTTLTLTYALTGGTETYTVAGKSFVSVEGLAFGNGFCLTNIGATNLAKSITNGLFYLRTTSGPSNTGLRLAQEYLTLFNTESWELKFDIQTGTLANTPLIRFGMYDLTSTSLTPLNGIGVKIINATDGVEPSMSLEYITNGTVVSQDTSIFFTGARQILTILKTGTQITVTVNSSSATGYAPISQYVWTQTVNNNNNLYYSPSIYLGGSRSSHFQEMFIASIKYQELNTDLL